MEITRTNFEEALPKVKDAIDECTFLAIDTEFTGLHDEYITHVFDTMDERYVKMCETAKDFLVIQVGLSCFKYHEENKSYTHKDFNFYVFPRQHSNQAPDSFFKCSASSLNFLMSYNFDFNKLIKEGVSYLTPSQKESLHEKLTTFHEEKIASFKDEMKSPGKTESPNVPDEHKEFIKNIHNMVEEYVSGDSTEPLSLPSCSGYKRKLIYQTVQHKYPTGLSMNTVYTEGNSSNTYISILKLNNEEKLVQMEEKYKLEMSELEDAVGFRKVLDAISDSKKMVLGHNMLLDLFHILNQFYFTLPVALGEFKQMLKGIFPHITDTKTLASCGLRSYGLTTALFELLGEIETRDFPRPVVEGADGYDCYTLECDRKHDAGYDAYVTGLAYISLVAKLAMDHKVPHIPPGHKILKPFVNRPYIMRHFDIQSLNLNGSDPEGKRDYVFHATFPKQWKTTDLIQLFHPFGEVHVCWIDDISAFIALKSPEQHVNVKRKFLRSSSSVYKIITYADYCNKQKGSKEGAKTNETPLKVTKSQAANVHPNCSIPTIVEEEEENEIENGKEKQDNSVSTSYDGGDSGSTRISGSSKPKRMKLTPRDSESHEVSSTEKLFKESDEW